MTSLRALLAACLCAAVLAARLAAAASSLDERLGLVSPKYVRMFTVGSPCQATQASLGWFTGDTARKPQQNKPNRVGVIFAYNPSANDARLNGIQEWKVDVVSNFVRHFTHGASNSCLERAQTKVDSAADKEKEDKWTAEMPTCASSTAFKRAAKGHLETCLADISAAFPKRNDKLPQGMQGLVADFKLGGDKPSCALACGAAMLVDGRLKSCSIATVSEYGSSKLTKMLSTSGSSGKPNFLPGDIVFPTSTLDSNSHPALETTMTRWKNRAAWQSRAKAAALQGVTHAQQVPAPATSPTAEQIQAAKRNEKAGLKEVANVFPGFAGQCSEDKILGAAHEAASRSLQGGGKKNQGGGKKNQGGGKKNQGGGKKNRGRNQNRGKNPKGGRVRR